MKKNNDKISIIVPVYNSEKYLKCCIESILNQTYVNLEVVLVNDGSKDESLRICNDFKEIDKRIVVVDLKNSGVSTARNMGIKVSSGKYISFVDSDDILMPTFIEELYSHIIEKEVDVVRCNYIKRNFINGVDIKGNMYNLSGQIIKTNVLNKIYSYFCTLNNNIPCYVWLLLIKKEKIVEFDFTLKYMEDTEFYVRLLSNINSIYFLDKYLYVYRINNQSVSNNIKKIKSNINEIIKTGEAIKKDYVDLNFLNEKLLKSINTYLVTTIINKLKLLNDYSESSDLFAFLKSSDSLNELLNNLNKKEIPKKIMIDYFLLKKGHYKMLFNTIKLKKQLKGDV